MKGDVLTESLRVHKPLASAFKIVKRLEVSVINIYIYIYKLIYDLTNSLYILFLKNKHNDYNLIRWFVVLKFNLTHFSFKQAFNELMLNCIWIKALNI